MPAPSQPPTPSPTDSYLHGTLALPGDLKLRFLVSRTPDGATLDIPVQRVVGSPITDFVEAGDTLTFTFAPPGAPANARARFSATREADGRPGRRLARRFRPQRPTHPRAAHRPAQGAREETMAPAVLKRIVEWTRASVGLEKPNDLE